MKSVIYIIILTLLVTCGTVYSNPFIDGLEQEMERIYPNIGTSLEALIKYSKLREIRDSMIRQDKDNKIIREWEQEQKNRPCESMFRKECEKVII